MSTTPLASSQPIIQQPIQKGTLQQVREMFGDVCFALTCCSAGLACCFFATPAGGAASTCLTPYIGPLANVTGTTVTTIGGNLGAVGIGLGAKPIAEKISGSVTPITREEEIEMISEATTDALLGSVSHGFKLLKPDLQGAVMRFSKKESGQSDNDPKENSKYMVGQIYVTPYTGDIVFI